MLPDLLVSAVVVNQQTKSQDEDEDLQVYNCPVFMNRVSKDLSF